MYIGENIIPTTYVKHSKVVMVSGKPKRVGSNLSTKFFFFFCSQKPCSEVAFNPLVLYFQDSGITRPYHYNVNVGLDIACNCCFFVFRLVSPPIGPMPPNWKKLELHRRLCQKALKAQIKIRKNKYVVTFIYLKKSILILNQRGQLWSPRRFQ